MMSTRPFDEVLCDVVAVIIALCFVCGLIAALAAYPEILKGLTDANDDGVLWYQLW